MNSLLEKKKLKDILPAAINITLGVVTVGLIVLLIFLNTWKADITVTAGADTAALELRKAELIKDVAETRMSYEEKLTAAQTVYRNASTEEQKLQKRYAQLSAEMEAVNSDIAEIYNYPAKIEQARSEYAGAIAELEQMIINGESDVKIAYLTFDDGPYVSTEGILDTLKEYGAKATFFTNGHRKYAEFLRRELREGHSIANHTYSHGIQYGLYSSVDAFMYQVEKQNDFVKETTGFETKLVRFPGGSNSAGCLKASAKAALTEAGYAWADWDALTGDSTAGVSITRNFLMNTLSSTVREKNITVILLHDLKKITKNTLPEVLDYLTEREYIFLPLFYESCMVNK